MTTTQTSADTATTDNTTATPERRMTAVERLPKRYAGEPYVQYLAEEVDRGRADYDRARKTESRYWDMYCRASDAHLAALKVAAEQEARANAAELQVSRLKASRLRELAPFILVGVFLLLCCITQVAQYVWGS